MQISIEILSQMMTRTGSGSGVRQKSEFNLQDSTRFIKAMEEAMISAGPEPLISEKNPDTAMEEKATGPADNEKPDNDTDVDENLATGAMVNQIPVIFILEGDKESATTPDICEDTVVNQTGTVIEPEAKQTTIGAEGFTINTQEVTAEATNELLIADTHKASDETEVAAGEENSSMANSQIKAEPETVNNEVTADSTIGEVTARMPTRRTSERQENTDENSGFSEKGNLSPLENDNDKTTVKDRKEKTFSETVKGMPETVNNTPMPLAEGIKPDQFRANEQMKQATLNTPVKTENLFDEMVSRIETMKTESRSTMSIQLKPEFLGKVALEIAVDSAGLHVKINAADNGVRTMINGQINALIESLENKGIEVVDVEVVYSGLDNGAFKESRGGQAQPDHPRRLYREIETTDAAAYYPATPFDMLDYYLETDISSVEYRA